MGLLQLKGWLGPDGGGPRASVPVGDMLSDDCSRTSPGWDVCGSVGMTQRVGAQSDLLEAVASWVPAESLKQGQKTGFLHALSLEIQGGDSEGWGPSPVQQILPSGFRYGGCWKPRQTSPWRVQGQGREHRVNVP